MEAPVRVVWRCYQQSRRGSQRESWCKVQVPGRAGVDQRVMFCSRWVRKISSTSADSRDRNFLPGRGMKRLLHSGEGGRFTTTHYTIRHWIWCEFELGCERVAVDLLRASVAAANSISGGK